MIGIIDFGSQYTQLIARKVRELSVFSKIYPYFVKKEELSDCEALIFSGSPKSVLEENHPDVEAELWDLDIPILGICYGLQLIAKHYGGEVLGGKAEFGKVNLHILKKTSKLFIDIPDNSIVWMSHGDYVYKIPEGFELTAETSSIKIAAIESVKLKRYGIQFHPEVYHSVYGTKVLENFLFNIANAKKDCNLKNFVEEEIVSIKREIGSEKAICGISGGIDSTVSALLVHKAIGNNLKCVFVDHGLLRAHEREEVVEALSNLGLNLTVLDKKELFLSALKGVSDPEEKRKIIGKLFIDVFSEEAKFFGATRLVQGTLYPDFIESSGGVSGITDKIKSHHNVGGLPEDLNLKLIEPLKYLFKDEVRIIGRELGIDDKLLNRRPFPGPGLAIRIIGEITEEKLSILRHADLILREELAKYDKENKVWQGFAVLLPIKSVGVMGDRRTYSYVIALRMVESTDGMTATWHKASSEFLEKISNRITNEVKGINRVVYDITSKPPATIEWE